MAEISAPAIDVGGQASIGNGAPKTDRRQRSAVGSVANEAIFFVLSHSSPGGVQELWVNLAEGFQRRGLSVELYALYPLRTPVRETPASIQWQYVVPNRPTSIRAQVHLLRQLVRLFAERQPAIAFTAMPAANVLVSAVVHLARTSTRVVTSHHSPAQTHNWILNTIDGLVGCLPKVQSIVSVSEFVAASLHGKPRRYLAKRRVIQNALPPHIETYLADLYSARRARGARRRVVATGRLARQKNYPLLVRAAVLLPNVEIVIIGDGPDRSALQDLAKSLGVETRIDFVGHRPREEALAMLADGDIFVQPSLFEGHSLALIEAANLGLPLIVSDVPVQLEGITASDGSRCGIAVGIDDHAGFAHEILRVLDDPNEHALWSARAHHLAGSCKYDRMMDSYFAEL